MLTSGTGPTRGTGHPMATSKLSLTVDLDPETPGDVIDHIKQLLWGCVPYVQAIITVTADDSNG